MITKHRNLFQGPLTEEQLKNTELNLGDIQKGNRKMRAYPRRIVTELTNDCNINCVMCGRTNQEFKRNHFEMEWFNKLEESFQFSEEIVLHGWGEPMIHPAFKEIMAYLDRFPIRKYFVTNGTMLDHHMETIFDHHLDLLAVSLDGARAQTNNKIRCGSDFDRIIESIRKITRYRDDHQLDYPIINFVFTGMEDNIRELPMMIDLAWETGVEEVKMVYLTAFSSDMVQKSLYNKTDLVRRIFEETIRRADELGIKVKLPPLQGEDPLGEAPHYECHFPFRDLFIGSDGHIRLCVSNNRRLFNIEESACFDEIWNHPSLQMMRGDINHPLREDEECRGCYHSSTANWNLERSFIRLSKVLPEWGKNDDDK